MDDTTDAPLPAGDVGAWLAQLDRALAGDADSDVPCDGCTACCRSSQFVHVAPDERDTLDHIPAELLFPAPGAPPGHVVMGYDEHGRCPMLGDDGCTIYDHRPRTCRTYDCRVLAAAGIEPDDKPLIVQRSRRWRFTHPTPLDDSQHAAVRSAAAFLGDHGDDLPGGPPPPTQLAVLAVEVRDLFAGATPDPAPDPATALAEIRRRLLRGRP